MSGIRRVSDLGTQGVQTILDGSIQTADIANNAITQAKMSTDVPLSGMRNLIINGGMRINQRNTTVTGTDYTVDRWRAYRFGSSATWSVASSTDAPAGFSSSLRATVTSGASLGEYDELAFEHRIEGNNFAHLDYGKSSAVTTCLSFWVRSSVAGTYAVELTNNAATRNYITSYVINAANTWEKKTLVITGDTTGTWETGVNTGILLRLYLAAGTGARTNTVNQWSADSAGNLVWAPAGTLANPLATTNNIFAITGVQLEAGSQATPFEQRPFGAELALCQRYYWRSTAGLTTDGQNRHAHFRRMNQYTHISSGHCSFPVTMRTEPTVSLYNGNGLGAVDAYGVGQESYVVATGEGLSQNGIGMFVKYTNSSLTTASAFNVDATSVTYWANIEASAEL